MQLLTLKVGETRWPLKSFANSYANNGNSATRANPYNDTMIIWGNKEVSASRVNNGSSASTYFSIAIHQQCQQS